MILSSSSKIEKYFNVWNRLIKLNDSIPEEEFSYYALICCTGLLSGRFKFKFVSFFCWYRLNFDSFGKRSALIFICLVQSTCSEPSYLEVIPFPQYVYGFPLA